MTRNDQLYRLADALSRRGLDDATVGLIVTDIGDLRDALRRIALAYRKIAEGGNVEAQVDEIESEARDHMPGHVKSIERSARKVRRGLGVSGRNPAT